MRHTYGETPDPTDPDILEINGQEYEMQPVGMRAMRKMLDGQKRMRQNAEAIARGEMGDEDPLEALDGSIELILAAVKPHERERLAEQIEDSVGPALLANIVKMITGDIGADVGPTPPASSSDGSPAIGQPSTAGASPAQ